MTNRGQAFIAAAVALAPTGNAYAQDVQDGRLATDRAAVEDSGQLEDIIVTAQRQEERLQNVPIAVSAVTSRALDQSTIEDTARLVQLVPGLTFTRISASATPRLRGIGSSNSGLGVEPSVATYVDGVYIPSAFGSLMSLNNVERIEVLKGPQGTLFGRNATGGLVQIITQDPPTDFGGEVKIGYGNFDTKTGNVYLGGHLTDGLALDFAGYGKFRGDGFGRNLFLNVDNNRLVHDIALRSKLVWTPGDNTEIKLSADYAHRDNRGDLTTAIPGFTPAAYTPTSVLYQGAPYSFGGRQDIDAETLGFQRVEQYGFSATLNQDFGWARFVNILAYRNTTTDILADLDAGRLTVLNAGLGFKERAISNETQLLSSSESKFTWVIGLYYFNNKYRNTKYELTGRLFAPIFGVDNRNSGHTKSFAGYAQGTYEVLPRTNLTLGVRYTKEKREATFANLVLLAPTITLPLPSAMRSKKSEKATFRVALDHKFTDDVMAYLSWNRGFKSGGFSLAGSATAPIFNPETLDAYEAGLKTELFDRKVRFNSAIFLYKYSDIQVTQYVAGASITSNAAKATVWGIDSEIEARVTPALTLRASAAYLHSNFDEYASATYASLNPSDPLYLLPFSGIATGNELAYAPKFTGSIGGDYTIRGSAGNVTLAANLYHSSGFFGEPNNLLKQPSYNVVNASVRWNNPGDTLSASLWANNLLNEKYTDQRNFVGALIAQEAPAPPATYGVTIGVKF